MAYNNGFPVNYQQFYSQYQAQPQMQTQNGGAFQNSNPQPTQNNFIWVQGEAGAKSYLVAPNTTVQLWDSENQVVYLKSADATGMPSMKILDYTIRETGNQMAPPVATPAPAMDNYVTREELADFEERIKRRLDKMTPAKKGAKDEQSDL